MAIFAANIGGGGGGKKTPAKQSTKTTSIFTAAGNAIKSAITKAANVVASAVKSINEASKKKAAAEAAAKGRAASQNAAANARAASAAAAAATGNSSPSVNNSDLISWGNHRFFATPGHVRSYKSLQIATTCNTEDEENGGTKYVKKKNDGGYEMKFTAILDQRLGETDVRAAAMALAEDARTGAVGYVYNCGSKLFTPQMMGTGATIKNIVTTPSGIWISCEVDMTLKQCSKGDGSTGSSSGGGGGGGGGGGYKYSVTVYYSGSSGAIQSVTGYSNVSQDDARKKAWAKVPGNAQWASETKKQATNQTTSAKKSAEQTTQNAKNASKYVNDKINSVKKTNSGTGSNVKPVLRNKPVALVK